VNLEGSVSDIESRGWYTFRSCAVEERSDDGFEFARTTSFDVEEHRGLEVQCSGSVVCIFRSSRETVTTDRTECICSS